MIKQLFTSLILIAFVAQVFSGMFIRLDYFLNTSSYIKNCENKAKPKLKCGGKCQMMKKIRAEEKKDEQNPERKFETKIEVLSSKSFFCSVAPFIIEQSTPIIFFDKSYPVRDMAYGIFHPPQV